MKNTVCTMKHLFRKLWFFTCIFLLLDRSEQTFEERTAQIVPDFSDIEILEPPINSWNARSVSACLAFCMETVPCVSYSYNAVSGQCDVFNSKFSIPATIAQQPGYNWTYFNTNQDVMETTAALPTTTTVLQCPTGECSTYGSSKYLIIDIAMTWDEGQAACQPYGGKLAEAETPEENDFIKSLLQAKGGDRYFIGGYNYNVDATFEWASDPNTPISYSDWEPGQPNTPDVSHCLYSNSAYQYRWGDISCVNIPYPCICEIPLLI